MAIFSGTLTAGQAFDASTYLRRLPGNAWCGQRNPRYPHPTPQQAAFNQAVWDACQVWWYYYDQQTRDNWSLPEYDEMSGARPDRRRPEPIGWVKYISTHLCMHLYDIHHKEYGYDGSWYWLLDAQIVASDHAAQTVEVEFTHSHTWLNKWGPYLVIHQLDPDRISSFPTSAYRFTRYIGHDARITQPVEIYTIVFPLAYYVAPGDPITLLVTHHNGTKCTRNFDTEAPMEN